MPYSPEQSAKPTPSRIDEPSEPFDWSEDEASVLKTMATEMATLRDKIKNRDSTPAEELRFKNLVDKMGGMIEAKESKPTESRPEFRELMESEREKLKEFFGEEIKVPPLPESITPKRVEEWKEMKFELHYLPKYELAEEVEEVQSDGTKKKVKRWKSLPGWENKLKVGPDQLHSELPGGWVLMDTRQKPSYANGTQMYEDDDVIGEKIKALREDKDSHIEKYEGIPNTSRFDISGSELDKREVREALAEALGIKPEELDLAYGAENSVLMHMHMPSWGNTNTFEWFKDKTKDGRHRFYGGVSASGGLAGVNRHGVDARYVSLGFRPLGRFSS